MSGSAPAGPHTPLGVRKDRLILTFYKYYDARHVIMQSKDKAVLVHAPRRRTEEWTNRTTPS
jgi:hypothetical protein